MNLPDPIRPVKLRFESLDSFRGLCAISVVFYHMHVTGSLADLKFFRHADVLVEFFFVLSGFVLAYNYSGKTKNVSARDFLISRTFRLFPLHWFMLAIFIILEVAKLIAYRRLGLVFNTEPFTGSTSPVEFLPNFILVQSWLPSADELSFNYPSWSISVEYYLYAIFLITMFLRGKLQVIAWACCAACALAILFTGNWIVKEQATIGIYCFFSGALSYVIFIKVSGWSRPSPIVFSILEVTALVVAVFAVATFGSEKRILTSLLYCIVIIIFAFDAGLISKFLHRKLFLLLGKLSYSIYLTHAAILFCLTSIFLIFQKFTGIALAPMINGTRYLDTGNVIYNNIIVLITVALVVLISAFTYRTVETRFQRIGKSLMSGRTKPSDTVQPVIT